MYKDKDKQREANRQASQRRRDKINKAMGMTNQGMTVLPKIIPKTDICVIPCESHRDASDIGAVKAIHQLIAKQGSTSSKPKPQSHNPMMVGYVPPKE